MEQSEGSGGGHAVADGATEHNQLRALAASGLQRARERLAAKQWAQVDITEASRSRTAGDLHTDQEGGLGAAGTSGAAEAAVRRISAAVAAATTGANRKALSSGRYLMLLVCVTFVAIVIYADMQLSQPERPSQCLGRAVAAWAGGGRAGNDMAVSLALATPDAVPPPCSPLPDNSTDNGGTQEQLEVAQRNVTVLQDRIGSLQKEMGELKKMAKIKWAIEATDRIQGLEKHVADNVDLEDRVRDMETVVAEKNKAMEAKEHVIHILDASNKRLQAELPELQAQLHELQSQNGEESAELSSAKEQIQNLSETLHTATNSTRNRITILEEQVKQCRQETAQESAKVKTLAAKTASQFPGQAKVNTLKEEFTQKEQKLKVAKETLARIAQQEASISEKEDLLKAAKHVIAQLQVELEQKDIEVQKAKVDARKSADRISELETQLNDMDDLARSFWTPAVSGIALAGGGTAPNWPAKFIVVVSDMRSGSTEFANGLARGHHCLYTCNQFFTPHATPDCLDALPPLKLQRRWFNPVDALQALRFRICKQSMPTNWHNPKNPANVAKTCSSACAVVIKVFSGDGLRDPHLSNLLGHPNVRVVILERNPAQRSCSIEWASKTGDWSLTPQEHARSGKGPRPPCPSVAPPEFTTKHKEWFSSVRSTLSDKHLLHLEVPFESFVSAPAKAYAAVYEFAGFTSPEKQTPTTFEAPKAKVR